MDETKPFTISKEAVYEAYKEVKANNGTSGIDNQSIADYEKDLDNNLYKLWNRMSSGCYFPQPVKMVAIPKPNGGTRILGIPTVEDKIAQMTAKKYFEPCVEPLFHKDSYGYRPNKSAIDGVAITRERCWRNDFVLEFDIQGLFDNIDHKMLMQLVKRHTKEKWIVLYIERWLKSPFQTEDGTNVERMSGTPQGGVISPVLANLFLHYVFDEYMAREFPKVQWARYADDAVIHCKSEKQAQFIHGKLIARFFEWGLKLHPQKTKIVYCKSKKCKDDHTHLSLDFSFLGFTFRPREAKNKQGELFTSFLPAISGKAKQNIREEVRSWRLQLKSNKSLQDLADTYNRKIQGWRNYYSYFYPSELYDVFRYIDTCLIKWARRKYNKLNTRRKAEQWLKSVRKREPTLFAHWKPFETTKMVWMVGSRMKGDFHVRF
jgi:group II intron reverse transcriptase/maturase